MRFIRDLWSLFHRNEKRSFSAECWSMERRLLGLYKLFPYKTYPRIENNKNRGWLAINKGLICGIASDIRFWLMTCVPTSVCFYKPFNVIYVRKCRLNITLSICNIDIKILNLVKLIGSDLKHVHSRMKLLLTST